MKTYKERLENIHTQTLREKFTSVDWDKVDSVKHLCTPDDGYQPKQGEEFTELLFSIPKYMKRFDIGTMIQRSKWGDRRVNEIRSLLRKTFFPSRKDIRTPVHDTLKRGKMNQVDVFDTLKKDVKGKQFSNYDFARVARTETARVKSLYQLEKYKEAGLKYVIYKTRNDNRVGDDHKVLNNREYEIEYLLSPAGDKDRIPNRPNCLVSWKTPVFTDKGQTPIGNIKIGDNVLTHKGNFKEVVEVHRGLTDSFFKIELDYKETDISVTGNHKIMTQRGWVEAKDLLITDKIQMKATRCLKCNKLIPMTKRGNLYCSLSCFNSHTTKKQWERQKNNKTLIKKISDNMRQVAKKSHELKTCFSKGWKHTKETKDKISSCPTYKTKSHREKLSRTLKKYWKENPERHSNHKFAGRNPSSFENKLFLQVKNLYPTAEQGKYIKIYHKNKYKKLRYPDILIEDHKLIIEFDGGRYHQVKKFDKERDKELNRMGYKVLHYKDILPTDSNLVSDINNLLNSKHKNLYRGKSW